MEGIKASIVGEGVESSVEFSLEEVIAHHQGKPWADMSEQEHEEELKDYALMLYSRNTGLQGDLRVSLSGGSFSRVDRRSV
ncbi:hypothetical protein [Noviherbaspirillum galbum]|uniref:Uncharacterized protein n=1 Tax=Noviherbaspirillum galbum TaxID=2709383 RepID=A0A6B3SR89_9BURK|nr:hypothetical protein [Noviherbaspirillum galbum]NEX63287.1 hypothetical protein [Noviherbaspirillum galbum]